MEIRTLKYFLRVAQLGNFTKAAISLNLTQPTLSRQLASLESELGVELFCKKQRTVQLTDEGHLLKRRAQEILELQEKTLQELKETDALEGTISIGTGEYRSFEVLSSIIGEFKKQYPKVKIIIHTASADVLSEKMDQGLLDICLFLEPINTENYEYIRLNTTEYWAALIKDTDELALKQTICKKDLLNKTLILPTRNNLKSEFDNWFGKDFSKLNVAFESNLLGNASILVRNGLGCLITVEGATSCCNLDGLVLRRLEPALESSCVIAWRRTTHQCKILHRFIDFVNALKA